ncbi:MAG: hypothetical protein LC804_20790 [Acidobacteria bacterium]|nr:hypothetical protein [Acidobacteriota bacterium]
MTETDLVTVARGDGSRVVEPRTATARTDVEWHALWAAHAGLDAPAPRVDFTARIVGAAFAGEQPSPGFEIAIVGLRSNGLVTTLTVEDRRPPPGMAAQIIVTPFHIVTLPRTDGEVRFENSRPDYHSTAPTPTAAAEPSAPASASSTGLEPTIAAALAYLVGPLSGFLVLLAERSNRFVRFHAWQAILGLGGLWMIAAALYLLAFVTLFVSATGFRVMLWLSTIAWVCWVVVWIVCLVKAFTGQMWRMPLVGPYAERRSSL